MIAVKIIDLAKFALDEVKKETCVHKLLKHPNIVEYYGSYRSERHLSLLLQLSAGGELFDKIGRLQFWRM